MTDVVICHGGNGTAYQALSCGIPVLCKTAHLEQDYNVDGLERLGVGKSLEEVSNKDYMKVVEEWTQKKDNKDLLFIKWKIAEANNRFGQTVEKILSTLFEKELQG